MKHTQIGSILGSKKTGRLVDKVKQGKFPCERERHGPKNIKVGALGGIAACARSALVLKESFVKGHQKAPSSQFHTFFFEKRCIY